MKLKTILIISLTLISCQKERTPEQIKADVYNLIENSNYQNALNDIEKLLKNNFVSSEIFTLKGLSESQLNKNNESILSFEKAINLDQNYFKAFVERAKLKIKLGDYKSAIDDCNRAMLIKKDFASTYKTKAKAYELLKDEPNAIIQYQAAIKYGDNTGENNYKLGVLMLNKGDIKSGCKFLSLAGEKGYMDAYDLIKTNCNEQIIKESKTKKTIGQFRSYPNKFAIKFPSGWSIDKISNSDNSTFFVFALGIGKKDGNITISETIPIFLDTSFKPKTIYDIDKDEFLEESKNKYKDFQLLDYKKIKVDKIDAYYYKMTFSFFSTKLQKQLSGIHTLYVFLHPKTGKLYNIIGYSDKKDIKHNDELIQKSVKSFKFL